MYSLWIAAYLWPHHVASSEKLLDCVNSSINWSSQHDLFTLCLYFHALLYCCDSLTLMVMLWSTQWLLLVKSWQWLAVESRSWLELFEILWWHNDIVVLMNWWILKDFWLFWSCFLFHFALLKGEGHLILMLWSSTHTVFNTNHCPLLNLGTFLFQWHLESLDTK